MIVANNHYVDLKICNKNEIQILNRSKNLSLKLIRLQMDDHTKFIFEFTDFSPKII
jgi:hypothetical protein